MWRRRRPVWAAALAAVWLMTPHASALRRRSSNAALEDRVRPLEGSCYAFVQAGEYWGYEWCHRRWVKQFQAAWAVSTRPEHVFADGERCKGSAGRGDGARKRHATVRFRCCTHAPKLAGVAGRNVFIESVDEPETCSYVVTVCARLVCDAADRQRFGGSRRALAEAQPTVGPAPFGGTVGMAFGDELKAEYREKARRMFYKGYDAYMAHAFPKGELLPRSCVGAHFDLVKLPVVTLVDAVDTLAILGNRSEFQGARLDLMEPHGDLATGGYDDELLKLAVDLGWRLLPAFDTATGIPYGTVNLAYGVPRGETTVSSLAGAGSLSLEFSVLSALSGNPDFGRKARASARALYDRRSVLGLLGKHINIRSGKWVEALSGIGSNSDSFYEYLLKVYLVFGDVDHWDMFLETYARIGDHVRQGDWYADVDMFAGKPRRQHFENLQAFWPGLQVLAGDVALAARSLNAFWGVWADWGVLPEEYDYGTSHLLALDSIDAYSATDCGYASVLNAATHALDDEMPSFFLAETTKYLYLIFDDDNVVHAEDYVFSTEAHPFSPSRVRQLREERLGKRGAADDDDDDDAAAAVFPEDDDDDAGAGGAKSLVGMLWKKLQDKARRKEAITQRAASKRPRSKRRNVLEAIVENLKSEAATRAARRSARCHEPEWWEGVGYKVDFEDSLENALESVVVGGPRTTRAPRRPLRCGLDDDAEREDGPGEEESDEDRVARVARELLGFGSGTPSTSNVHRPRLGLPRAAGDEPKRGRAEIEALGAFDVEVFSDGFHVANSADGETLEISNVGSSIMLVSSTVGDDVVSVTVASDGNEVACDVAVFDDKAREACDYEVEDGAPPRLFVAKRGACMFEEKALKAQRSGAGALLVVNSVPGQQRFIMARAGSDDDDEGAAPDGDDVAIPAVMVSAEDGAALAEGVAAGRLAHLRVYKRPVASPRVAVTVVQGRSIHVAGRGKWGVFLNARPETDDWQLFIVKTEDEDDPHFLDVPFGDAYLTCAPRSAPRDAPARRLFRGAAGRRGLRRRVVDRAPAVNVFQASEKMPFVGIAGMTAVACGGAFFTGLRLGRSAFPWMPAPDNSNFAGDANLSMAIGGASSFFVGTDVAYLGGDGNFLRPLVGVEDVDSDLLGVAKAGTSTGLGFMAFQSVQNVVFKEGEAWLDAPPPEEPEAAAEPEPEAAPASA
ncbi:mannosyl-oligosaccharide 1,2-alpha-mannosidase [Aureococcus anophagefferens]|nr:mannosyl-oligosaccharide 1,2-alpha-mannosidase [Aureococcus anophagefferens]